MIKAESSATVARPVETVYDFVVVRFFENYPRWSPEVIALECFDTGAIDIGTRGRQVRVDQGRRSETRFAVTRLEPQRLMQVEGEQAARFRACYRFEPEGERRARVSFEFELKRLEFFMRPFEKLIRMAIRDGTDRAVRNIKGLVEREH